MKKDKTKINEGEHQSLLVEAAFPQDLSAETTTIFVQFYTASEQNIRSDKRNANGTC
jgi:hypothetical protein